MVGGVVGVRVLSSGRKRRKRGGQNLSGWDAAYGPACKHAVIMCVCVLVFVVVSDHCGCLSMSGVTLRLHNLVNERSHPPLA
jgi:hypothetical protein